MGYRYVSLQESMKGRGYETLKEFSEATGLDEPYLSQVINGKMTVCPYTVCRIEQALNEGHPRLKCAKMVGNVE